MDNVQNCDTYLIYRRRKPIDLIYRKRWIISDTFSCIVQEMFTSYNRVVIRF
jgi:hypothetical protein